MNRNSGDVVWRSLLLNSLVVSGVLSFQCDRAFSQVTPDDTLGDESSVVNTRDATNESIDGGAIRGQNLFHSFEEFNVGEDRGVYFANPDAVTDIFSRVTGDNVSNILGTLGVDGAANLFLINPNGIVFGKGASLDVQGSFAATTADGIEFGDRGFFGVSNPESPKLLTINPSAYLFNQVAPGAIANSSRANNNIGLQVQPGKNISLIGGDVSLDGGGIYAPGGRVELGGLNAAGTIDISNDGSLSFPENIARSDVFISNGGAISVISEQGGSIAVNAKKLEISGNSLLLGGVLKQTGLPDNKSGDIVLNAIEAIDIDSSRINNTVVKLGAFGIGNAGNININTGSLSLTNGAVIDNSTQGIGNAGNINIIATDTIFADGGAIGSTVQKNAKGNAGEINITTGNLALTNLSQINVSIFGIGNGGSIKITAADSIFVDNNSFITSEIFEGAKGNAGNIDIDANNLTLTNEGEIVASTDGRGNGGSIKINANNTFSVDSSNILSVVAEKGEGNAGGIEINTNNLNINNRGAISTGIQGKGVGGKIEITATDDIAVNEGFIGSAVSNTARGNGGVIEIQASNLFLNNGAQLTTQSFGLGNAGNINLILSDILEANNGEISTSSTQSSGGGINITTKEMRLRGDSDISTNVLNGTGGGGNIDITADSIIAFDDSDIFAFAADGQGGNITLDTPAYFGENSTLNSLTSNPDSLENNSRADINATGAVSGSVTIPDVSSIQNSLTELANDSLDTDELVANSCVVPVGDQKEGKFIITGTQSLPVRPGDGIPSQFPTGEVRSVPEKRSSWQPGDPIVEPQGAYRLANGKLVLSRECSQ
jgi:filamentous hemagglutinin family protein